MSKGACPACPSSAEELVVRRTGHGAQGTEDGLVAAGEVVAEAFFGVEEEKIKFIRNSLNLVPLHGLIEYPNRGLSGIIEVTARDKNRLQSR